MAVTENPLCPSHALDPLGHYALPCKHGRDVVDRLRDVLLESCRRTCLGPKVKVGNGLRHQTQPADILIPHWDLSKPASFDLPVISTLNSSTSMEAGVTSGYAALAAEVSSNAKYLEFSWCHVSP